MAGTTLMKIIIIIICMNTLLYLNGVRVVDTSPDYMSSFIEINGTQGNITLTGSLKNATESMGVLSDSGGGGIFQFIDPVSSVLDVVKLIINLTLTPFGLFRGMPYQIGLLIGLPLLLVSILGIAYFLRSGN